MNLAKVVMRSANDESWNKFIGQIEHIYWRQTTVYKEMKDFDRSEQFRSEFVIFQTCG